MKEGDRLVEGVGYQFGQGHPLPLVKGELERKSGAGWLTTGLSCRRCRAVWVGIDWRRRRWWRGVEILFDYVPDWIHDRVGDDVIRVRCVQRDNGYILVSHEGLRK